MLESQRRCEKLEYNLVFHYVVVSRDKVLRNFESDIDAELSEVYRWCSELKSLCTQTGWTYELNDGFSEDQKQMLSNIKMLQIPEKSNDPAIINKEMLNHWNSLDRSECGKSAKAVFMVEAKNSYNKVMSQVKKCSDIDSLIAEYDMHCIKQSADYWKEHDDHFNSGRTDCKAAVQLPVFVAKVVTSDIPVVERMSRLRELNIIQTRSHSRLWSACIANMIDNIKDIYSESLNTVTEDGFSEKLDSKSRRRKQFRVKPVITADDKVKLASVGIESRKYREDATVNSIIQEKEKDLSQKQIQQTLTDLYVTLDCNH